MVSWPKKLVLKHLWKSKIGAAKRFVSFFGVTFYFFRNDEWWPLLNFEVLKSCSNEYNCSHNRDKIQHSKKRVTVLVSTMIVILWRNSPCHQNTPCSQALYNSRRQIFWNISRGLCQFISSNRFVKVQLGKMETERKVWY